MVEGAAGTAFYKGLFPWARFSRKRRAYLGRLRRLLAPIGALYLVGGCVRDILKESGEAALLLRGDRFWGGDLDLAFDGDIHQAHEKLAALGRPVNTSALRFGTLFLEDSLSLTALRSDGPYDDGRHPRYTLSLGDPSVFGRLRKDAARRDFTINALYVPVTEASACGDVWDPLGRGMGDLEGGRLRFIGPAAQRLEEDSLRLLRFFRFWARGFGPAPLPAAALRAAAPAVRHLSRARRLKEIEGIVAGAHRQQALAAMGRLGLWEAVMDLPSAAVQKYLRRTKVFWEAPLQEVPPSFRGLARLGLLWGVYPLQARWDALVRWPFSRQKRRAVFFLSRVFEGGEGRPPREVFAHRLPWVDLGALSVAGVGRVLAYLWDDTAADDGMRPDVLKTAGAITGISREGGGVFEVPAAVRPPFCAGAVLQKRGYEGPRLKAAARYLIYRWLQSGADPKGTDLSAWLAAFEGGRQKTPHVLTRGSE